ncbi:MAG: M14 family zinc carboxypeptidase [bacterium]
MKKLIIVALLFLWSGILIAQNVKYAEVRISKTKSLMEQLGRLGLPIEEGFHEKNGTWTIVLSDQDLGKIKSAGVKFDILHEDYTAWVQNRNKEYKKTTETYTYPVPQHFEQGSMGGFYTLEELQNELDSMRMFYPNLISVKAQAGTTASVFGRPIYYLRISDNPDASQDKPRVLYNSLHHAREPMGMQQLIFFMWYLLENYATSEEIQYLVNNLELYFIPVVNPDGYFYNDSIAPAGGGMWRKNRQNNGGGYYGIDLNRNYSYKWGYDDVGSSPYPYDETYRGPDAFSEPETQAMRDFCMEKNFKLAMNYHTYQNIVIYPWAYKTELTSDSTLELEYAAFFTKQNGYNSGTPGQILYNTNGDASDWQYGEQSSKTKIFAFTTEIGGAYDGFWPFPDRIIPLAEENVYSNLMMAHFALRYAEVKKNSPVIIPGREGYFTFSLRRYGLDEPADYTVAIEPLDPAQIINVGPPKTISNPLQFAVYHDSISYQLSPDLAIGSEFRYILSVNNGLYTFRDTVTHFFGPPLTVFSDTCNDMSHWTSSKWNVTHNLFHSPDGSITDSPNGNYQSNANVIVTTTNSFDLGDTPVAVLEFWARWNIEKGFDYAQVKVSDNNGSTWTPLSGIYTHSGSANQFPGQPVYDNKVYEWVKEEILLNNFLGKQVKLRYNLVSDDWANYDGFYFDDVKITKIDMTTGLHENEVKNICTLSEAAPNPATERVTFNYSNTCMAENSQILITDSRGIVVKKIPLDYRSGSITFDLDDFSSGIYFCSLVSPGASPAIRKLVVIR